MVTSERRRDKMAANAVEKEKYVQFLSGYLKMAELPWGCELPTEVGLSRGLIFGILGKPTVHRPCTHPPQQWGIAALKAQLYLDMRRKDNVQRCFQPLDDFLASLTLFICI